MNKLINVCASWKSIVAFSLGGLVFASCSNEAGDAPASLDEYQAQVYSAAFIDEFGKSATDHNWGFGSFNVAEVSKYIGSYEYFTPAATRAVADNVTSVNATKYNTFDDAKKEEGGIAKCYFYLRIDNRIVLQEQNQVMSNPSESYYPKSGNLGNNVQDVLFSKDNEGLIDVNMLDRIANVRDGGVSYATSDEPIPNELFKKAPSFETMALHVPDQAKITVAGSVEKFNKEWKIFWYVAKWQGNGDKIIHVDGVLVPKEQITVNVPEYKKRIIVEDLKGNINASTQVSTSDFDFNDVVFDAITWKINNKNHLKIIVRAAGGQMPIYVAGKEIHEGIGYMFNTSNPNYEFGKVLVKDSIISTDADKFDFNSIPVEILVNGAKVAASSNIGQAPEKIAVELDYKWCKETNNIKDVYSGFARYVTDKNFKDWWKTAE